VNESESLSIDFTRYYDYRELTTALETLAAIWPDLVQLHSIGQSCLGQDLRLMEITNSATGPGDSKPGYYIDANTHPETKPPLERFSQVSPMYWAKCFSSEKREMSTVSASIPAVMTTPRPFTVMRGLGIGSM